MRSQRLTKRIPVLLCVTQLKLPSTVMSKRKKTLMCRGCNDSVVVKVLTHGHLYRETLTENKFGNEEAVAGAHLKITFDHPEVSEDNTAQLRSFYDILHVAVSTLKSLIYEHDLAPTGNLRRAVQKLPERVKTRWGEKRVEMLPKTTTLDNGTESSSLKTTVNANGETVRAPIVCPVCSHAHIVEDCAEFKGLNVDKRAQLAKENLLCFRCPNSNEHQARQCSERRSCEVENCPKHHYLLIHGAAAVFV